MKNKLTSLTLLKGIIWVSVTATAIITLWLWIDPESLRQINGDLGTIDEYGGFERLVLWQRIAGFTVHAIPASLLIAALYRLNSLLRAIEGGRWFDDSSERHFRAIGHLMLWQVLTGWLGKTALVLILTATNGEGHRVLIVELSNNQILGLVPALMALVIAEMVSHARAQRDELNQII